MSFPVGRTPLPPKAELKVELGTTVKELPSTGGGAVFVRPDTFDEYIFGEVARSYGWMRPGPADTLLDLGANIGAAARWATLHGATVHAYEPDPANFSLLLQNAPAAVSHQAAVIHQHELGPVSPGHHPTSVHLYLNGGRNRGGHSLVMKRRRDSILVPAVPMYKALKCKPTLLKCDVEGSEYSLLFADLPGTIRALAVEYHLTQKAWRNTWCKRLHDHLCTQFNLCIRPPAVRATNWTTLGWYVRPD